MQLLIIYSLAVGKLLSSPVVYIWVFANTISIETVRNIYSAALLKYNGNSLFCVSV